MGISQFRLFNPGLMERTSFISDCVAKGAEELGYPSMKHVAIVRAERETTLLPCNLTLNVYITQQY